MSLKWFLILFFLIVLIAGAPLWVTMGAGAVADYYGCSLNEGSIQPCMIDGEDYGRGLYTLMMMGWFGIATVPIGFTALCILCGIFAATAIIKFLRDRR